jgi:tRNA threonylcarbamoyladenosine biosynthesis protein TsaB
MRMLLINTCGGEGVVALADEAGVIASEPLPGRGTSEALLPAVHRLFPDGFRGVQAVGVVIGPGSFTGVRVGLAAAKGFCEAAGIGMVAMSRLALVAADVRAERAVALLDGGRGEFYAGIFDADAAASESLVSEAFARELIVEAEAVTCEARVVERLGHGVRLVAEPGAEAMRAMVLDRAATGQWSDIATVDANYLRRTDAELLVHGR